MSQPEALTEEDVQARIIHHNATHIANITAGGGVLGSTAGWLIGGAIQDESIRWLFPSFVGIAIAAAVVWLAVFALFSVDR